MSPGAIWAVIAVMVLAASAFVAWAKYGVGALKFWPYVTVGRAAFALFLFGLAIPVVEAALAVGFLGVWLKVPFFLTDVAPSLAGVRASSAELLEPALGPIVAPLAAWALPLLACWGCFALGLRMLGYANGKMPKEPTPLEKIVRAAREHRGL